MDVAKKVKESVIEHQLLEEGDKVVVAVSGGPDSVALLHVLQMWSEEWGLTLIVAHVDHRFRGEASEKEAEGVAAMAESMGLACEVARIDVPEYIQRTGHNAQDAARRLRYAFLINTARRYQAKRIALGHHADDQAETVLMNLLRGAGADGLEGMPIRRRIEDVELVRPLLGITKSEIIAYCNIHKLQYYLDQSNQERRYFRNQIRLDVLPYLQQFNPQLTASLVRMADTISADNEYVQSNALRIFEEIISCNQESCSFARNSFLSVHVALQRRLIKLILNYLSANQRFDFSIIEAIREAVAAAQPTTSALDVGAGLTFVREYDHITVTTKLSAPFRGFAYSVDHVPYELVIPELGAALYFEIAQGEKSIVSERVEKHEVWLDIKNISFPLTVRSRQPGDRIKLLGLNGTKKIKELFIDLKIPPSQRERIPLVVDAAGEVLWIPGVRRSASHSVHANTECILHITYKDFIQ